MKYLVVVERTKTGFSAYSPDLGGCVATGRTRDSVVREMQRAIEFTAGGFAPRAVTSPPRVRSRPASRSRADQPASAPAFSRQIVKLSTVAKPTHAR